MILTSPPEPESEDRYTFAWITPPKGNWNPLLRAPMIRRGLGDACTLTRPDPLSLVDSSPANCLVSSAPPAMPLRSQFSPGFRAKRAMDVVLAGSALVLLSPVFALVGAAVFLTMGRPILFRQERPGIEGKPFKILKFRTMRNPAPGERETPSRDRARLTPLGAFLRTFSLDELPQLWNILRGEMSLVGPRPQLQTYLYRYSREELRRHDMPPGLTGWAQIHGRNRISWEERLELDLWYIDHWSFWLDWKILLATIPVVLLARGVRARGHATMTEFRPQPEPGTVVRRQGEVEIFPAQPASPVQPSLRLSPEPEPVPSSEPETTSAAQGPGEQESARRSVASL